ncbi:uncharacterized protein J7T54_000225 [Emericellopsis cladophorae]|uniref:Uncharacterized protein n=1 Tax=Emericellopsis cladophorae TaxID=2686198 RepID=A0A9P9XYQ8_9HYPO|nr:uncharacterized protein J7T54_000225 [Emericellopsis cladophorae]KAI6779925.1 hypothetical protein J7T54_000225 [Emericellopsis cladophorae]
MKPSAILVAALACSATAAPVLETRQFGLGGIFGLPLSIFGQGINLAGDIFDSAACAFSTVIGGRSSLCFNQAGRSDGNGKGVTIVIKVGANGGANGGASGGANGGASGGLTGGISGGISGSLGGGIAGGSGGSTGDSDANGNADGAIDADKAMDEFGYGFKYKTVGDRWRITITPNNKELEECEEFYPKDSEKGIQELVAEAALECLNK